MTIRVKHSEDYNHQEIVDNRRPSAGLYYVIPSSVFECSELECSEIVFYALVSGLALNKGYCFASDEYLAERMKVDERTIRKWFVKLEKLNFLQRKTEKKGMYWDRKIYIIFPNLNNSYERTYSSPSNGLAGPDGEGPQGRIVGKEILVGKVPPLPPQVPKNPKTSESLKKGAKAPKGAEAPYTPEEEEILSEKLRARNSPTPIKNYKKWAKEALENDRLLKEKLLDPLKEKRICNLEMNSPRIKEIFESYKANPTKWKGKISVDSEGILFMETKRGSDILSPYESPEEWDEKILSWRKE